VYYAFSIPCPFRDIFGIPCPTCGMSRSLISLVNLDVCSSLSYNPFTIPFCFLLLFALYKDAFNIKERTKNAILISGVGITLLVYVIRLIKNNP
jgi:hypothetical protein